MHLLKKTETFRPHSYFAGEELVIDNGVSYAGDPMLAGKFCPNRPSRLNQDLGSRLDLTPSAHNRSTVTVWTGSTLSVHRWCTRPSQSRSAVWPLTPSPPASLLTLQKGPSPFQKTTRRPLLFKNISINAPAFFVLAPIVFQK